MYCDYCDVLRAILCLGEWRVNPSTNQAVADWLEQNISGQLFGDGFLFHFEAVLRALVAQWFQKAQFGDDPTCSYTGSSCVLLQWPFLIIFAHCQTDSWT